MIGTPSSPAVPVGQQGPPARAAASAIRHSAASAGPSYGLPGRPLAVLDQPIGD